MFKQAEQNAPCIVFIDEIDSIGKSRDSRYGGGNDEREQTLNALLAEMDGFDTSKGILILAATNRPEWLEIAGNAIVGTANEMTKGEVKVIENSQYVKYVQNGTLTFADEDGVMSYSFPLVYKGMDPKSIKILDSNPTPWNWEVSLDGKTFTQTSGAGTGTSTTTSTYNKFVPYTVQALSLIHISEPTRRS